MWAWQLTTSLLLCVCAWGTADMLTEEQQDMVDSAAELLYGLIHARFVLTQRGLNAMYVKYKDVDFGRCHRVYCQGQPVLPCGQSDVPRKTTVNVYCPRCNDLYFPKSSRQGNIDGAYFGTTFPHLFFMTFPNLIPQASLQVYTPRVFGFKVHDSSAAHIPNVRHKAVEDMRARQAVRIKKRREQIAKREKELAARRKRTGRGGAGELEAASGSAAAAAAGADAGAGGGIGAGVGTTKPASTATDVRPSTAPAGEAGAEAAPASTGAPKSAWDESSAPAS